MNELITACLQEETIEHLVDFPRELLNSFESGVITWIIGYTRHFSKSPHVKRVTRKFPHFVPIGGISGIPIEDILEETLERKTNEFVLRKIANVEEKIRSGEAIPLDILHEILRVVSLTSGVAKFSTYDRTLYFRTKGLDYGFKLIDKVTGGAAPGDFDLIVGRLGAGKSTIAQWITYCWWLQEKRILYVSNEMLAGDVFGRIDGMVSSFNPMRLRTETPEALREVLELSAKRAKEGKGEILVPLKRLATPNDVGVMAKNLGVDAVVIDGVYLMSSDTKFAAKWEKVSSVSNAIKQTAMDLEVPILGVTQTKRVGEKDEYDPEDIAYSDALGQDADKVMFIVPNKAIENRVEIQLVKNRYGPPIATVAYIDFETMRVTDETILGSLDDSEPKPGKLW